MLIFGDRHPHSILLSTRPTTTEGTPSQLPAPAAAARRPHRRPFPGADQAPARPRRAHQRIRAGWVEALVKGCGRILAPHKADRARIILACAEGMSNARAAQALGVAVKSVSKWRRQFAAQRLAGLEDAAPVGATCCGWAS